MRPDEVRRATSWYMCVLMLTGETRTGASHVSPPSGERQNCTQRVHGSSSSVGAIAARPMPTPSSLTRGGTAAANAIAVHIVSLGDVRPRDAAVVGRGEAGTGGVGVFARRPARRRWRSGRTGSCALPGRGPGGSLGRCSWFRSFRMLGGWRFRLRRGRCGRRRWGPWER